MTIIDPLKKQRAYHAPVKRYVTPEKCNEFGKIATEPGFKQAAGENVS